MVDPVCWFQLTRSQKEVNKLPGLAEDKETEKKGYNKIHIISKNGITFIEKISVSLRNRKQVSLLRTTERTLWEVHVRIKFQ